MGSLFGSPGSFRPAMVGSGSVRIPWASAHGQALGQPYNQPEILFLKMLSGVLKSFCVRDICGSHLISEIKVS